jgi:DNA-binding IclR family transcriptional regulator
MKKITGIRLVASEMDKLQPSNAALHDKAGSMNRAARILAAIATGSSKGSLLTELIGRTGLPRTTIMRTLEGLIELGWVEQIGDELRFNLGLELTGLAYSAMARNPLERIAATELSKLAEKLKQVVYLSIRSGLDMICIGRYESRSDIQIGRGDVGLRGPFGMTQCCMGIMAHLAPAEVNAIIEANMGRYYRIEGFDETGFKRTVKAAMQNGYGTYDDIILDRTTSGFGVAILDSTGYPIAGIGTTYLTGWLNEEQRRECLQSLQNTAHIIQQQLFEPT